MLDKNKKIKKTYREAITNKEYIFNPYFYNLAVKEYSEYNIQSQETTYKKIAEELYFSINQVKNFARPFSSNNFRFPRTIDTCKSLGKILCDDEYAFLISLKPEENFKFIIKGLTEIYYDLYRLFAIYDLTDCFNQKPVISQEKIDVNKYYEQQMDLIEENSRKLMLFAPDNVVKEVNNIIFEARLFMCGYEQPGVADSWLQANPKIKFYDAVYYIAEESPVFFNDMKRGKYPHFRFRVNPTENDFIEREKYFKELQLHNEVYNFQFSRDRQFQNELLNTLTEVFRTRFLFEENYI